MLVPHTGQHGACVEDDLCLTGDLQEKNKIHINQQKEYHTLFSALLYTKKQ